MLSTNPVRAILVTLLLLPLTACDGGSEPKAVPTSRPTTSTAPRAESAASSGASIPAQQVASDAPGASPFPDWMTRPTADGSACTAPTTRVSSADQLQDALASAGPGTVIDLAPGTYVGRFVITASGTDDKPARLCGPVDAVLDGGDRSKGYVLHLDGAQHWVLHGFSVHNGQKGVVADGTTGTTISGLTVYGTGDEAVHLRRNSTDNLVPGNTISDTGSKTPKFGEGVYIGTATSNWCDITDCQPDRSDRNQVRGNAIYATSSEPVDLKEGTTGGILEGNQFDGSTISGADSWVDVKGNDWKISGNVGRHAPLDGFQTHDVEDGWGTRNTFSGYSGSLDDPKGFLIAMRPVNDNRASCDNRLLGEVGALSNEACR